MNLAAYDIIMSNSQIKTWIDKKHKRLCSVEIPFYKYYYLAKRYDVMHNDYDYFLIFTNTKFDDPIPRCVYSPRPGLIRIDLSDIWIKAGLDKAKEPAIRIEIYDNQEDGVVYLLSA